MKRTIIESEGFHPRLVCWLPVVDEVRTKIYSLSREFSDSCYALMLLNAY
jgi:hypothetical protein